MIRVVLALLILAASTAPVLAHSRSQSASHWRIAGDRLIVRVEAMPIDVTRLGEFYPGRAPDAAALADYARESFAAATTEGPCIRNDAEAARLTALRRADLVSAVLVFDCPKDALAAHRLTIGAKFFFDLAPMHMHFLTVSDEDGGEAEGILTDTHRRLEVSLELAKGSVSAWRAFARFLPQGMVHVYGGVDHIAFILALTLLAGSFGRIALASLGFTLGHSCTLILAALGVLAPNASTVEAMIGFTIAFTAIERGGSKIAASSIGALALVLCAPFAALGWLGMPLAAWFGLALFLFCFARTGLDAARWSWLLAALFGLIHGCGFAGALAQLDLPPGSIVPALAGFNIGVELAQLTIVACALLIAAAWRRLAPAQASWAADAMSAGLLGLGLFWFVSRAIA